MILPKFDYTSITVSNLCRAAQRIYFLSIFKKEDKRGRVYEISDVLRIFVKKRGQDSKKRTCLVKI